MEEITSLAGSETGKIIGVILLMVGLSDALIARLVFARKIAGLELQLSPALPPEQKQPQLQRIRGMRIVTATLYATGAILALAGIYLMTR